MTKTELSSLIQRLTAHGRADDLNALVADTKRLHHSEREAIEAIQTVAMQAVALLLKLAALEPVTEVTEFEHGTSRAVKLFDLTGVLDE